LELAGKEARSKKQEKRDKKQDFYNTINTKNDKFI